MTRSLPRLAALVAAVWMSAAAALGLGDIDVRSRLNQRFAATIPLTAATADDLQSLKVSLASNAEFERAGLERPAYLSTLRFEVKGDGAPRIEITSDQAAREPFLTLMLDVREGGNRIVREYTVFLDPPDYSAPTAAESEFYETATESARRAEQPPAVEPEPVTPAQSLPRAPPVSVPEPAPAAEMPSETASAEGSYGPIRSTETLWSVATRLRPAGVTMDQMLLALYSSNPAAFDGGINGLLKGAVLTVPAAAEIAAVSPDAAREELQRLRGTARTPRPAAPSPQFSAAETAPPAAVQPAPIIMPEPAKEPETYEEPAAEPAQTAPAVPETPAVSEPAPGVGEEPSTALSGDIQTPAEELPPVPAAETPAPTDDEIVVAEPAREPLTEESGLLETLLLPLIGGLVVLGGIGLLVARILARRKAGAGTAAPASRTAGAVPRPSVVAKPAAVATAAAAASKRSAQDELEDLQATLDQGDARRTATESFDTQQLKTQQMSTQQLPAQSPRTAPGVAATQLSEPPAAETEAVDFDLTGQFESQTVQINLDANDPVSEADFHLAYGLYDEAALLLKQAAEKEPNRADIRVKLAETYFAAGKSVEFQECATAAKPMLSAAEWQKIAIMGQQLAPDAVLFREGAGADMAQGAVDLDLGGAPVVEPATDAGLDFKLDAFEMPEEPRPEAGSGDKGEALEFDLTQFDLAAPAEGAPAAGDEARADAGDALDFDLDLGSFDTEMPKKPAADQAEQPAPADTPKMLGGFDLAEEVADIRLDDIDLGDMPAEGASVGGDEAATKLDLARAYVDMGDNEMARSLLEEVVQQGSAEQKQDAQALIQRLTT